MKKQLEVLAYTIEGVAYCRECFESDHGHGVTGKETIGSIVYENEIENIGTIIYNNDIEFINNGYTCGTCNNPIFEMKHGEYIMITDSHENETLYQWNDIFEKLEEFDPAEYLKTVIVDIDYLMKRLDDETPEQCKEEPKNFYKRYYIGSCFIIYPSGKYYMPWSSNVTEAEALADEITREYLEKELDKHGIWLESGEGSSEDLFIVKSYDLPENIACYVDDDGDFISHSNDYNFVGYPLYYVIDGTCNCAKCANDYKHLITDVHVNYENNDLYCDGCGEKIEAAYSNE
jgi:hypothetical protein